MEDYATLNKMIIIADIFDEEYIMAGIALPASRLEAYLAEIEKIATETFDGVTFAELLTKDIYDMAVSAAIARSNEEAAERVVRAAEQILRNSL